MLAPRWYKVLNDLAGNKTRTTLIVLSIAVGLFAVGVIVSSRTILSTEMNHSYAAINPGTGVVRTFELFEQDFVNSVRAMPEVSDVDARRSVDVRLQVGVDEWINLRLFAVEDYDAMRVNRIAPYRGAWPPPDREILIERSAVDLIKAEIGDSILIEMPGGKRRWLRVAGLAHDMAQVPAQFDGSPYGYVTFDTIDWLGEAYGFNELHVVVRDPPNEIYARHVVNEVKDKAERSGYTIPMSTTVEPGTLPLGDILDAILLLMGVLGLLSLFLSTFLIINTVSALMAQQRRQIGVMKAIGAHSGQIMTMYLAMVMLYGLVALLISVPLSVIGARQLSEFLAAMFNFDLRSFNFPLQAIVIQLMTGLLVPVLASLYPFLSGLRVTAAEAMSAYGMAARASKRDWLARLFSGENLWATRRLLLRPWLLSLRNTFRSKGRLVMTLITLSLAGSIFISVFSVRSSIFSTLDDMLRWWNFDMMITLARPHRSDRLKQEVLTIPNVAKVDIWAQLPAHRVRPDGSEGNLLYMFAPRVGSDLINPPAIVAGRWLLPEDDNAIVVNTIFMKDEPDLKVGDEFVLKIDGKERTLRLVGVSRGIFASMVYVHYDYIAHLTGDVGNASSVLVLSRDRSPQQVEEMARQVEKRFNYLDIGVSGIQTMQQERAELEASFGILVSLLLIMSILLALVGGLGLMGTMSINVLERTREIGVLRSIGASNGGVSRVFILEGIGIGLLSWLIGFLTAIPLGRLLSDAVGVPLTGAPLNFTFSMTGVWLWLVLVILLSSLASLIPARNASHLTVREVLAYE